MTITVEHLSKTYESRNAHHTVFDNVNFTIGNGENVAILGASGSGKTTLMNILGLVDNKYIGRLLIDNQDCRSLSSRRIAALRNRCFGFIYQEYFLIEKDSVFENVRVPLLYSELPSRQHRHKFAPLLESLEIAQYIDKPVFKLSGGERQRVAIARALVNDPKYILADEPTGSLDKKTAEQTMALIKRYTSDSRSLILVTHDERLVDDAFDHVFLIGDGKVMPTKAQLSYSL